MNKTWFHFIGGYYKTTDRFVREAKRIGITRRIPAQVARGINFGDRMILLRWQEKSALAFAEAVVTGITLDTEVSEYVQEKLKEQGKIQSTSDEDNKPYFINRECGSYIVVGSYKTTATIPEIIDIAIKYKPRIISRENAIFVMVSGKLTLEYHPCVKVNGIKFTRGITLLNIFEQDQTDFFEKREVIDSNIITTISNYKKAS